MNVTYILSYKLFDLEGYKKYNKNKIVLLSHLEIVKDVTKGILR